MKLKFIIKWILGSFIIGFLMSILIHHNIIYQLGHGLKAIPFYGYILLFPLIFYVTLSVHELTHLITFRVLGVKIRALYLTMFIFYFTDLKRFRIKIKPKLWILMGGFVVPNLPKITDEKTYKKVVNAFSKSLIAAPIATFVFAALSVMIWVISLIFSFESFWVGFLTIFTLYTLLFSTIYILASRLKTDQFYGDFVAHKHMRSDDIFALAQIHQYQMFSLETDLESQVFIFNQAVSILRDLKFEYKQFHLMVLNIYLEGVLYNDQPIDEKVHNSVLKLYVGLMVNKEASIQIAHEIASYFYKLKNVHKAYDVYHQIIKKQSRHISKQLTTYLDQRTRYILHIENTLDFISKKENMYLGQGWILDVLIDPYQASMDSHEQLPYVAYLTEVKLDKEKDDETSPLVSD